MRIIDILEKRHTIDLFELSQALGFFSLLKYNIYTEKYISQVVVQRIFYKLNIPTLPTYTIDQESEQWNTPMIIKIQIKNQSKLSWFFDSVL